jgi:hypothetical protein
MGRVRTLHHGEHVLRGGARAPAGFQVKIAPDQQEEEQHGGGIEIDIFAVPYRLEQAHAGSQYHGERDGHVHIGVPGLE